jgi:hypothetical protein
LIRTLIVQINSKLQTIKTGGLDSRDVSTHLRATFKKCQEKRDKERQTETETEKESETDTERERDRDMKRQRER